MDEQTRFSEDDFAMMRAYEQRTGERIIYSFEEKCRIYRKKGRDLLARARDGIQRSIWGRLSLDNEDSFDGPDDSWKLKVLQDNLRAIEKVLSE